MDDSGEYGTPTNAASPGANAILAQPPLQQVDGSEGTLSQTIKIFLVFEYSGGREFIDC